MGPWDPSWRPDPTGHRLVAIRAARRGALVSALLFGSLEVVATVVARPVGTDTTDADVLAGVVLALFSLPALALLGAGLTSAALGSRSSAVSAALAMGVGIPVASAAWVVLVRRLGRPAAPTSTARGALRPGRGPRRPGG